MYTSDMYIFIFQLFLITIINLLMLEYYYIYFGFYQIVILQLLPVSNPVHEN